MLKKLLILAFAGLLSPAYGAGTINLALTQQIDKDTFKPLAGGKLYFFQAGTVSTPQIAYQDSGLTIPLPGGSVYTLDASGRIPQFFLADGQIKVRLTNKAGIVQFAADNILVIGPSGGGGGGGGSVDPTTVLSTGDIKARYGTGVLAGFVRQNGRTIGSSASGATERANADCQALFEYLWTADPNLAVSTGRGVSANADWVANKTITLPDMRGRSLFGMDDMGSTSSARLGPAMGISSTTLGGSGGAPNAILTQGNLPSVTYNLSGLTGTISVTSNRSDVVVAPGGITTRNVGGPTDNPVPLSSSFFTIPLTSTGNYTPAGTIGPLGSSGAFNTLSPAIVVTLYQKL